MLTTDAAAKGVSFVFTSTSFVCHRQLRLGATIGATAVTCVVFLFGFGGLLAAWSGLFVPAGPDDYGNTILFSLLDNVNGHRHTAIVVVVAVLCAFLLMPQQQLFCCTSCLRAHDKRMAHAPKLPFGLGGIQWSAALFSNTHRMSPTHQTTHRMSATHHRGLSVFYAQCW